MTWELRRLNDDAAPSPGLYVWTPSVADVSVPKPLVVLGQPWNSDIRWVYLETARELTDKGFIVAATNFRGDHGTDHSTAGLYSFDDHAADYLAIAQAAVEIEGVDRLRVILHGYSYSATPAALAAPVIRPAMLVIQAPALYPDEDSDKSRTHFAGNDTARLTLSKFWRQHHFSEDWDAARLPLKAVASYTALPVSRLAVITHGLDEFMPVGIGGSFAHAGAADKVTELTIPRLYHFGPEGHTITFAKPLAELIEAELPLAFPKARRLDVLQTRCPAHLPLTSLRITVKVGERIEVVMVDGDALHLVSGDRGDLLVAELRDQPLIMFAASRNRSPRFALELLAGDGTVLAESTQHHEADHHLTKRRVNGLTVSGWQLPAHGLGLLVSTDDQDDDAELLDARVGQLARQTATPVYEPLATVSAIPV